MAIVKKQFNKNQKAHTNNLIKSSLDFEHKSNPREQPK